MLLCAGATVIPAADFIRRHQNSNSVRFLTVAAPSRRHAGKLEQISGCDPQRQIRRGLLGFFGVDGDRQAFVERAFIDFGVVVGGQHTVIAGGRPSK